MNAVDREVQADRQRRAARGASTAHGQPVGLSATHIPPRPLGARAPGHPPQFAVDGDGYTVAPTIEVALGGTYAAAHLPRPVDIPRGGGRRGAVKAFSPASRRRLQRRLATVDRRQVAGLPLFVTLTYPAWWPKDGREWKRHLDNFLKRLKRRFPRASAIWKLEYQKRGAPHFHLLVFGLRFLAYRWVAEAWFCVVDSGDFGHLNAGTEVKRVRTWRGVAWYAAKYMSKVESLYNQGWVGRYWGVHNRAGLPTDVVYITLPWHEVYRLRRVMYRVLDKKAAGPRRRDQWTGVSIFIEYTTILDLVANHPQRGSFQ